VKRVIATALAAALLLLTACTGMPSSGTVYPGRDPLDPGSDPGVAFVPDGPQPGATPDQIVEGFLRAGTGVQNDWAIAQQFLTREFAGQWQPSASVTVDKLADRAVQVLGEGEDAAAVAATVGSTGFVDGRGAYSPQQGIVSDLPFELVRQDGEWRISRAQDGIVLSEEQFRTVYRQATLAYFDPTWQYIVPDVRWFPRTNTANYVATALLDEPPSPWLADAVRSAFPEGVYADQSAISDGVTQVAVDEAALSLGTETLGRMQRQLDETFRSIDQPAVRMTVDGSPLVAAPAAVRSTRVDPDSLVQLADGAFGFVDGDGVIPLTPLSDTIDTLGLVSAVAVGPRQDSAAVLTSAGAVVRVTDEVATLDSRAGLIAPSIDPAGTVWSVPADTPAAVQASPAEGDLVTVVGAWPEATGIRSMQVSRDGARVAALVSVRGRTELWVAGIRRDDVQDGGQIEFGERLVVTTELGEGLDLAWLDDTTIGVLERVDGDLRLRQQTVGGLGTDLTVPAGSVRTVGGNGSPRLLTEEGAVYNRQGTVWQQSGLAVHVLAVQLGVPTP